MNIIEAVKLIKTGKKVKRNGKRSIDTIKDIEYYKNTLIIIY